MISRTLTFALVATLLAACKKPAPAQVVQLYTPPPTAKIDSSRRTAIVVAVERVAPAVVTVQTQQVQQVTDIWDLMNGGSGQRTVAGLGSGFIVRQDGYIVTNAHVIAGATTISVALRDGTTYKAKVIGADQTNDLAVIKVDATGLPVAPLGTSSDLMLGEWTIAIGNPYGFVLANSEPSVTVGVVSGVGRNLAAQAEGAGVYVDMIQTDAAINPGNSGGPLVNAAGQVIGVNSSIYSPSGGSIGLGFAIPINRARRVAEDLIAHGTVRRPWVGIKPQVNTTDIPRNLASSGVVVASVTPGSPAAIAGIRRGDVIEKSHNRVLHNAYDWEAEQLEMRVGETVPLLVKRGSREMTVTVKVQDLPEVNAPRVTVLREIELVTLTPQIRAERNIRSESGALVRSTSARVTNDIGLQEGDVIVQINRMRISSAQDAARALNSPGRVVMYVERQGQIFMTEFVTQ
jgi:serine protease Do